MTTAAHPLVEAALKAPPSDRDQLLKALVQDYVSRGGSLDALPGAPEDDEGDLSMPAFDNAPLCDITFSPEREAELERRALTPEDSISLEEFMELQGLRPGPEPVAAEHQGQG